MKPVIRCLFACCAVLLAAMAAAQSPMPRAAFSAKTIAIVNDTKSGDVVEGATAQLQRWGHFTVIGDPDAADIVLRFDQKRERDGHNTAKSDDKGNPTDWGYTMTFSNQLHMRAYLKGSDAPFYTTKSDDGKKKGGLACVSSFEDAWLAAR